MAQSIVRLLLMVISPERQPFHTTLFMCFNQVSMYFSLPILHIEHPELLNGIRQIEE